MPKLNGCLCDVSARLYGLLGDVSAKLYGLLGDVCAKLYGLLVDVCAVCQTLSYCLVFYMANTMVLCFTCQSIWHHVIMCIGCAFQRHDMNIFSTLAQQHTQHHTMTTLLPAQSSCIPPFQFHRNSSEMPHGAITRSTKEVTKQHILTGSSIDPTHTNRSSTCQYYNTDLPSISLPCLT